MVCAALVTLETYQVVHQSHKTWKKAYFLPGQGKVRGFYKKSGENGKNEKRHGNVMDFFFHQALLLFIAPSKGKFTRSFAVNMLKCSASLKYCFVSWPHNSKLFVLLLKTVKLLFAMLKSPQLRILFIVFFMLSWFCPRKCYKSEGIFFPWGAYYYFFSVDVYC